MSDEDTGTKWEEEEFELPRQGDPLFMSGPEWIYNARLNIEPPTLSLYAKGYKKAADLVVESVREYDLDYVVYPVCYLYRHYLELQLKNIINIGRKLLKGGKGFPQDHDIQKLWKECKSLLEEAWPGQEDDYLDPIEQCIEEFVSVDKKAESFRYPRDKQGNLSLRGVSSHINLRNLAQVMSRIASCLDGAADGVYEMLRLKWENEAECRSEGHY